MRLRTVIREQVLAYFRSSHWTDFVSVIERGDEVFHAHIYTDSILHPRSIEKVAAGYFAKRGTPLQRKVGLLSHGRGYANVYYLKPAGACHFEIFARFDPNVVITPMAVEAARGGNPMDFWDDAFMAAYYEGFAFHPMGQAEMEAVRKYFASDAWNRLIAVMAYENERSVHGHAIVQTSLHPEEILPIGIEEIERRGWKVDKAVSVVFGLNGHDQGKITFLVKRPEIVLELEWEHDPRVVIKPAVTPVARVTTTDMVERDLGGIEYVVLDQDDVNRIVENL